MVQLAPNRQYLEEMAGKGEQVVARGEAVFIVTVEQVDPDDLEVDLDA